MIAALTVVALLAPGPRIEGAFETGQRRQGEELRRLNGGRASVDHLFNDRWRLSLGYLARRETVTEITVGDADTETTKTQGPALSYHQVGLLAGFEHRWLHASAGLGLEASAGLDHQQAWALRPAGRLRLGPRDLVFADLAAYDPSPWSPGPGRLRAGVGSRPGGGHLWVGWAQTVGGWALGAAARVPVDGGLHVSIAAAVDPRAPGDHLVLQGGLGWTFGAPKAEAPPEGRDAGRGTTTGPLMAPPPAAPATPPVDPMGAPL